MTTLQDGVKYRPFLRGGIFLLALVSGFRALPLRRLLMMMAPSLRPKIEDDTSGLSLNGDCDAVRPLVQNVSALYLGVLALGMCCVECLRVIFQSQGVELVEPCWLFFASGAAEVFGLVFLRHKIHLNGSVHGVSMSSMILYSLIYFRRVMSIPPFSKDNLYALELKALEVTSFILVLDVLRCMLGPYRKSYQEDADKVRAWHVALPAFLIAAVFRPLRGFEEPMHLYFSTTLNVDVFALLPQVVLMAWESCPVQAPIAHFVLATAFSRSLDLYYWTLEYHVWSSPLKVLWSGWFVIGLHLIALLLVADFFYYYVKARLAGHGFQEDTPVCEV